MLLWVTEGPQIFCTLKLKCLLSYCSLVMHYLFQPTHMRCVKLFFLTPSVGLLELIVGKGGGKLARKPNLCFECSFKQSQHRHTPYYHTGLASRAGHRLSKTKSGTKICQHPNRKKRTSSQQLQLSETEMHAVLHCTTASGYCTSHWKQHTVGQTSGWIWSLHHCSWRESNRWTWWCDSSRPGSPVRCESFCCHGTAHVISAKR